MAALSPNPPEDLPDSPVDPTPSNSEVAAWIRSLDEIGGADLPLVGGKSYRLAQLKQYGLSVPSGLVLTTHFFRSQLQHYKLTPLWAGSPDVEVSAEALVWLADAVKTKPLEPRLAEQLTRQIDAHFGVEVDRFAVRSSVIDEDQRDHTFAGIHLTELGVPRSAIPIAVSRCWASALSEPAVQYRQRHGMSIQAIEVAVLIQPMLSPLCAGVGFTINPLTGSSDEIVLEAVWGGGSGLVAGAVQPHFYRLVRKPPDYPLIEQKAGSTTPPADEAGRAPHADPLSRTNQTRLAHQLQQIEALMGAPQDVEWALQSESLFFLQTRPVVLPPGPTVAPDQAWTRGTYRQSLPEIPSPLFGSLLERSQPNLRQYFRDLGFDIQGLGPFETLILGRPYLNITFLRQLASQVGLSLDGVLQAIGYIETSRTVDPFAIDWGTAWRARHIYRAVYHQVRRSAAEFAQLEARVERTIAELRDVDPAALPVEQQLDQLHRHIDLYQTLASMTVKLDLGIAFETAVGGYWLAPETDQPGLALMALATQDFSSVRTRLQQALIALGQLVRTDTAAQTYIEKVIEKDAAAGPEAAPAEFRQRFAGLLARYGDWATYESDPAWPRYREEPAVLLEVIRHYAQIEEGSSLGRAETEVSPARRSWRGWLLQPLVNHLHQLLVYRDRLAMLRASSVALCRAWSLAVGQQWAAQGWLARADDIFRLTVSDIERVLLTGQTIGVTLPATVQSRKETHATYAKTIVPYTLHESQLPAIQLGLETSSAPASDVTIGLPVSPGQVRGSVVVVRHPQETIPAGDKIILVMPATGPEWLPLLHKAAGLIVETGGLLSHGSVIAREYGLPAVANIPQATQRFRAGDQLLIDGSTGVVQLLEKARTLDK